MLRSMLEMRMLRSMHGQNMARIKNKIIRGRPTTNVSEIPTSSAGHSV